MSDTLFLTLSTLYELGHITPLNFLQPWLRLIPPHMARCANDDTHTRFPKPGPQFPERTNAHRSHHHTDTDYDQRHYTCGAVSKSRKLIIWVDFFARIDAVDANHEEALRTQPV